MKRGGGGMKKRCAEKITKNIHESKSVHIGDVLSSGTTGMKV
jgi:hypothetical protein